MFNGLIRKIHSIILPIFLILFTFMILIYFSFFHIIKGDFIKKSQQFPHQISKSFSLQLENIQKTTDTMIKKYFINDIDIENDSKIAITKSISCFPLYNPDISQVHLLKNDVEFLSSTEQLSAPLSSEFDYLSYDKCWFYSKTYNKMVYTQALSGDLTHIAVMFTIDSSKLLPQTHSPFSDFTEIYAVTSNETIYQILKTKNSSLTAGEILDISHSPEYSGGVYKKNSIYSAIDTSHNFLKIVSVQSADYINHQFRHIMIFFIFYLIFIALICILSIRKISRWVSVSLENLNEKLRTGIMQIDDLTACLKD